MRNQNNCRFSVSLPRIEQLPEDWCGALKTATGWSTNYLLVNRAQITQNALIMKCYSLIFVVILTAVIGASSFAQDKASLQSNATIVTLLQGSAGKSVELHLRSGEKMGGKVAQVTDNIVHLSNLTGAEYFEAFVDVKDISAVVVRVAGK
jgi:hypothetical protein